VTAVNKARKTFRLHDSERVESFVKRSNGRWVAIEVERSGGGGEHH
jgi:hypothetical protein